MSFFGAGDSGGRWTDLLSRKLLNEILSGEEADVVVEKVHNILRDVAQKMRENSVPPQKYIIYTKLGKNPKEYPNQDSMPQVQVALRAMAQGKTVRVNDVMAYIVTGDSASSENAAKRAFAPQDVLKADSELKPGRFHSLAQPFSLTHARDSQEVGKNQTNRGG